MNRLHILISLISFSLFSLHGQNEVSVISHNNYKSNPTQYLSDINSETQSADILIDNSIKLGQILNTNGTNKVTVLNSADWFTIYQALKASSINKQVLMSPSKLLRLVDSFVMKEHIYPIAIIDYDFKKISQQALDKENLIEGNSKLILTKSSEENFSYHKTFCSTALTHNVTGDKIDFIVPTEMFFSNNDQKIDKLEIDFDNGEGFKVVEFDTPLQVQYQSPKGRFLEIKTRMSYADKSNSVYYSHGTFRRTGTATVPSLRKKSNSRSTPGYDVQQNHCLVGGGAPGFCLEFTIIFSPFNSTNKLKRPFIVTDGFDPGNRRSFEENSVIFNSTLPLNHDTRGLYQFVNGDHSPWENHTSPNFISDLKIQGYDIIFVDFQEGAGDILDNGDLFKSFLEFLNGPTYRDNKTEMNVIVGPSMGGLITRYALSEMENQGIEHFTKTWIAFDSPMKGAYIPLSLQHGVDVTTQQIPNWISADAHDAKAKLNSPAARQLIKEHFDPSASSEHQSFYATMFNVGYPQLVKRYAITNGGQSRMFPSTTAGNYENLDFQAKFKIFNIYPVYTGNSLHNDYDPFTYHTVLEYEKFNPPSTHEIKSNYQVEMDGAVGGYNTGLYSLNADSDNNSNSRAAIPANFRYMKATFIPTASALGIDVIPSTVFDTWNNIPASSTPFDERFGMINNEDHVSITQYTANGVFNNFLHDDINNSTFPIRRSGSSNDLTINGPVGFYHAETVIFGGNNQEMTFEQNADVNIVATDLIKLESNVQFKIGAKVRFKAEVLGYGVGPRSVPSNHITVDVGNLSEVQGKLYDYSKKGFDPFKALDSKFTVSPNPSSDYIDLTNLTEKKAFIKIISLTGSIVKTVTIEPNSQKRINISDLTSGSYLIHLPNSRIVKLSKL